jgi:hypothetical protein
MEIDTRSRLLAFPSREDGPEDRRVDFVVAGAQKSGTTALDRYLRGHPAVSMARVKEVRFFDDDTLFEGRPDYALYHSRFDMLSEGLLGEATPDYLYRPEALSRLHEYNPSLKVICILRNPIDRAYSHWNMQTQLGREDRPFLEAVTLEAGRPPAGDGPAPGYVGRGLYAPQLARLWSVYPEPQTLVVRSDDLARDPAATMNDVFRFLGLEEARGIAPLTAHQRSYARPLSRNERDYLNAVFEGDIREVERLLGWDCSAWMD